MIKNPARVAWPEMQYYKMKGTFLQGCSIAGTESSGRSDLESSPSQGEFSVKPIFVL
jgi:hypothetical protein